MRKIASRIFNLLMRLLFKTGIDDHQCGFKAMRRRTFATVAPFLQDNAWFFDTELIVQSLEKGLKIKSIDIVWTDSADSKVSLGKTSYNMFCAAWQLRKRLNRSSYK